MNVFVLCTGRCGSLTFANACTHILNFSSAHESRTQCIGSERLTYPAQHIEIDNRLSWLLGRLDKTYGDEAFYVHLKRDKNKVAESFTKRYAGGIIKAYRGSGIMLGLPESADPMEVSLDYCETVNENIILFLKDKSNKMEFNLENFEQDLEKFWTRIEAQGSYKNSLAEFTNIYNASKI